MNYHDMPAGREMDALIAEKVMGHKVHRDSNGFLMPPEWGGPHDYSDDISSAWDVVEKMWEKEWWAEIAHQCTDGTIQAEFTKGTEATLFMALAPTAPLAICRAALMAVNTLDPKEEEK